MEAKNSEKSMIMTTLSRFRAGDASAFDLLISQFRPLMVSMTNRFCDPERESEWNEWFQEARIALYRAATMYRIDETRVTFGLYAQICIRNAFIDRERRRGVDLVPLSDSQEEALLFSDRLMDPLESLIRSEQAQLLYQRIASLLSAYELKVFDGMLEGMTVSEIASSLEKTEKSVSNAMYRLTEKLQQALQTN